MKRCIQEAAGGHLLFFWNTKLCELSGILVQLRNVSNFLMLFLCFPTVRFTRGYIRLHQPLIVQHHCILQDRQIQKYPGQKSSIFKITRTKIQQLSFLDTQLHPMCCRQLLLVRNDMLGPHISSPCSASW